VQEDNRAAKLKIQEGDRAAKLKIQELENDLKISREENRAPQNRLGQVNKISGDACRTVEDVPLEHGEGFRPSGLDDQAQQQISQLGLEGHDHQGDSLNSRLGHDYDAYNFDHRVSTDDEVMDDVEFEEKHDPDTLIDHDSFEHGRGSHASQLDNKVRQQDTQV
jgi:hypothetical protein